MLAPTAAVFAQDNPQQVSRDESAFVVQAPVREAEPVTVEMPQQIDASSKVYFPDEITPESVATARARAAQQEQLARARAANDDSQLAQVSRGEDDPRDLVQLSDGDSARALSQLSPAERQVLLEAVEGTDICNRSSEIPAIRALCAGRIETRSAEFAQGSGTTSPEDTLLGGGLNNQQLATLEAAIARLARTSGDSNDFSNQAIASVALGNPSLSQSQATSAESDPANDLSAETQALVAAIVQQLGGN